MSAFEFLHQLFGKVSISNQPNFLSDLDVPPIRLIGLSILKLQRDRITTLTIFPLVPSTKTQNQKQLFENPPTKSNIFGLVRLNVQNLDHVLKLRSVVKSKVYFHCKSLVHGVSLLNGVVNKMATIFLTKLIVTRCYSQFCHRQVFFNKINCKKILQSILFKEDF